MEGGVELFLYSQAYCTVRCVTSLGPLQAADLEGELGEARAELVALRLARISEREESAARVESMRHTLHTVMRQR